MKHIYIILSAIMLFSACSETGESGQPVSVPVDLSVAALRETNNTDNAGTRAAIDKWNNTAVSFAYREGSQPLYTQCVNVTVKSETSRIIHTGMQYPLNGDALYITGFHPVGVPTAGGIVHYDLSRGDLDLMVTQEVSGNQTAPILKDDNSNYDNDLLFEHKLTRITVNMNCAPNNSYPERIAALIVGGNVGQHYLPTQAELNLADGSTIFRALGIVMAGYKSGGVVVPPSVNYPAVLEAMVAPNTPLKIRLLTASESMTDINLAGSDLAFLETTGGVPGIHYVINLLFHSTSILVDSISIHDWVTVSQNVNWW